MNAQIDPEADDNFGTAEPKPELSAKMLPLPDVGDLLFVGIMHILLFARPDFLFQDASVGWHLSAGKWIFENHSVPRTDLFSYTFPDKPWVAYEWLFDLVAYLLTVAGGLNLLAIAVSSLIALVLVKTYDRCRNEGGPLGLATTVSIIGIFASAIHWLARPHIITLLCVFFYLTKLEDFYRGTISGTRLSLFLAALMLLWVNCHPAFPIGIALIGIYFLSALNAYLRSPKEERAHSLNRVKSLFFGGALVAVVTLINPYGTSLHMYILEYFKGSTVLANTDEYRSPVFHGDDIHAICLELLLTYFVVGLAISKKRLTLPYFATVLLFTHMALSAVRSIPYFAISSVPAIGLLFSSTRLDGSTRTASDAFPPLKQLLNRVARPFKEFAQQEMLCKMRILPICYVSFLTIAALMGGGFGDTKFLSSGFSSTEMPTKTLVYIQKNRLPYDRGFNLDNWGGLLRYKLDQRVFIDDRADFYPEEFYKNYGSVIQTRPGWEKILDNQKIEWVLLPKFEPATIELKKNSSWYVAYEDDAACLLRRKESE